MLRVLITGSKGQLGSEIENIITNHTVNINESEFFFTDRESLDICNKKKLDSFICENKINVIINCAAYTSVDKAEEDKTLVNKINNESVKSLAQISQDKNIKLIHVSTDYVFDGKSNLPYKEEDSTNPQCFYGKSKLDGEKIMININPANSIIIRTSWVYSSFGNNFVKTMLKLGKVNDKLGVIYDQIGTPTYAKDLAKTILEIMEKINNTQVEIYHYSNEGVLSWYDFAKEIMKMANLSCDINPIESKEYITPVKRPNYSVLNKSKIKNDFEIDIPYWKDGLDDCLRELGEKK